MDRTTFKSELGMLGLLGYRVGNEGRLKSERRKILDRVMSLPITPLVKERVENWEEWGEPNTAVRYRKMLTTLSMFASNSSGQRARARATKNWLEDLEYVRAKFGNSRGRAAKLEG